MRGIYPATVGAQDVAIAGNYAYLATAKDLRVVDIANPGDPWELARLTLPDYALGIAVQWPYAYVAA